MHDALAVSFNTARGAEIYFVCILLSNLLPA